LQRHGIGAPDAGTAGDGDETVLGIRTESMIFFSA
jgi:hypothetical protein